MNPVTKDMKLIKTAMFGAFLTLGMLAHAFDLQGHRGARGLAPENTLTAFDTALAIGVNTLELDVGVTKDGVVVISHDPTLNPDLVRNAQGQWLRQLGVERGPSLNSLSFAEVQTYDVGRINPASRYATTFATQTPQDNERIASLASLFKRVKSLKADHVRFNIETKITPARPDDTLAPEPFVKAILAVIDAEDMADRVSIQSFDWRTLAVVAKLAPKIGRVYLSAQRPTMDTLADGSWTVGKKLSEHNSVPLLVAYFAKGSMSHTWSPHFADLTEPLVREAQALGLKVVPWTANEALTMERLLTWRVDGIITDYPNVLRALVSSRGLPLAPTVALPK